jgi:hypothetical protein
MRKPLKAGTGPDAATSAAGGAGLGPAMFERFPFEFSAATQRPFQINYQ